MLTSLHRLALLTGLLMCLSVLAGRVSLPASLPSLPGAATLLGAAVPTAPARALISLRHRNATQLQSFIAKVSDRTPRATSAVIDAYSSPTLTTVPTRGRPITTWPSRSS